MDELKRILTRLNLKEGRWLGSGIHMAQCSYNPAPKAGDYAWDGDWGYLVFTGVDFHPFDATIPANQYDDSKQYPTVAGQTASNQL